MMYEAELERAHGQMLEEMQAMEEEKNRAIEEAFSRAQVEMKAVHENLAGEEGAGGSQGRLTGVEGGPATWPSPRLVPAGVRTNLLTLQPALRTLTHDYNSLKRQVRDFPLLLQETLRSARAEVSPPGPPPQLFPVQGGDDGVGGESLSCCSPSPPDRPGHRGCAQHQPGAAAQVPAGAAAPQEVS